MNWRNLAETLTITVAAIVVSLLLFGGLMVVLPYIVPVVFPQLAKFFPHVSLTDLYYWMYIGAFGTKFSWQNTLTRAAPLILTALCTALPARLGLVVIGGEGALVLGGLASVSMGLLLHQAPTLVTQLGMCLAGMIVGGLFIAIVGILRDRRGVNETIASLLLTYIAIGVFNYLVEGPMRDPASLNKPSTYPIGPEYTMTTISKSIQSWADAINFTIEPDTFMGTLAKDLDVHWGLAFGILFCLFAFVLMHYTTYGFAVRMVGGNVRAAQASGLPVSFLILVTCVMAGAAAGLAGTVEVAAVHRQANASLIAGYGFTGILVSFIARHHPLGIIPAAILFGGLSASSGILQRRLLIPDAPVQVLMGIIFVMILLFETLYGRFKLFTLSTVSADSAEEPPAPATPKPVVQEAIAQ